MKTTISTFQANCKKTLDHLKHELVKVRTGRATSGMLEGVYVDYYGSSTPLIQLGLINVPEPRMITVQVYDSSALDAVEKAIQQAGLGLNPARDGSMIRVPVPALTEERRKDIVKGLGKTAEESKIVIRNYRRDANDTLKKLKDDKSINEDDCKRGENEVQKLTDQCIKDIDLLMKEKEVEIMAV